MFGLWSIRLSGEQPAHADKNTPIPLRSVFESSLYPHLPKSSDNLHAASRLKPRRQVVRHGHRKPRPAEPWPVQPPPESGQATTSPHTNYCKPQCSYCRGGASRSRVCLCPCPSIASASSLARIQLERKHLPGVALPLVICEMEALDHPFVVDGSRQGRLD
jgi:hypothetical protein